MRRSAALHSALLLAGLMGACRGESGVAIGSASDAGSTGANGDDSTSAPLSDSTTAASSAEEGPAGSSGNPGDGGSKFDVGGVSEPKKCESKPAGTTCHGTFALECDGQGGVVKETQRLPGVCIDGTGCVTCLDGQFTCSGPRVLSCEVAPEPHWVEVETCDIAINETCDLSSGTCVAAQVLGSTESTGTYYQYSAFANSLDGFLGGYDVDSNGDLIYVTSFGDGLGSSTPPGKIDVYRIEVSDSDGDGVVKLNQHPDNPDETGPVEERTLTFVETLSIPDVVIFNHVCELYVTDDQIFVGGAGLRQHSFGDDFSTVLTMPPPTMYFLSHIGFDPVGDVWYASSEERRRVYQHDKETNTWGIAFDFPDLSGDHMDGLEVVPDPNTGETYVYVSDMTSDFIGQYRMDPELGWVQENLFTYAGLEGWPVEGMGFGALNHFWIAGNNGLIELGGGALADYTEPAG